MRLFLEWFWEWKVAKPYFVIFALGQVFIAGLLLGAWISNLFQ